MDQFRYVRPVPPKAATGRIAQVYAQTADEFGLARLPVFLTLSPSAEVLAATWVMLRESLLTGDASRTAKEVVALGVSMANRCPFCVAAHTTLLHATGDHRLAEIIAAGGTPDDPAHARLPAWAKERGPVPEPFAAEYIGTALIFHFINRMASALLTENLFPGDLQKFRLVRRVGGRMLAGAVRRRPRPGASLPLVALGGLPEEDRAGARLALLTALAPYRVTDADVTAWRGGSRTDEDLVRLCAFGAITATERAEALITRTLAGERS